MATVTTPYADSVETHPAVQRLIVVAQNYEWGRRASESEVAQLMEAGGQPIDPNKPYAELWMGTHPSGPSRIANGNLAGTELLAFIRDYPQALGDAAARFGADLPFLLKVLSVNTALSIQSHPNKELAEKLHREKPKIYKDANHKPEMAIALTDFQALCGFVTHEKLTAAFQYVPELRSCCGTELVDAYLSSTSGSRREALKQVFTALMTASTSEVKENVEALCTRLNSENTAKQLTPTETLALTLQKQYPGDVGILAAFFLNFITLKPGEALYLAANEPHAYISGEIVECMATSDNVLRAGLTPKLRDTDVLCSCLTYNQGLPELLKGEGVESNASHSMVLYRPPFEEFEVWRFEAKQGTAVHLPVPKGPLIMLMHSGEGTMESKNGIEGMNVTPSRCAVKRGEVYFVTAHTALHMTALKDMSVWFAAANSMGF